MKHKIQLFTHGPSVDRLIKIVITGIPTNITTDEIKSGLTSLTFEVQLIKHFGTPEKPMPICLVLIIGTNIKEIYELSELIDLKISVQAFRIS